MENKNIKISSEEMEDLKECEGFDVVLMVKKG